MKKEWVGFKPGRWMENVNLRDFISLNYKPYDGNEEFLCGTTKRTSDLFKIVQELQKEEIKRGILGIDINNISGIDNFDPGYIDRDNEIIVGLQTDAPFKRIINPYNVDLVILDIKHDNPEKYKEITGCSIDGYVKFKEAVNRKNTAIWLKHVVFPGLTDQPEHIKELKKEIDSFKNTSKLELLPYHTMGIAKYERLGIEYKLKDTMKMDPDKIRELQESLIR